MSSSLVSKPAAKTGKEKAGKGLSNSQSYSSQKQADKYYPSPFKNTPDI